MANANTIAGRLDLMALTQCTPITMKASWRADVANVVSDLGECPDADSRLTFVGTTSANTEWNEANCAWTSHDQPRGSQTWLTVRPYWIANP